MGFAVEFYSTLDGVDIERDGLIGMAKTSVAACQVVLSEKGKMVLRSIFLQAIFEASLKEWKRIGKVALIEKEAGEIIARLHSDSMGGTETCFGLLKGLGGQFEGRF